MSASSLSQRVAVVTGGNKGIGFEIVRKLCNQFDGIVYLTARDDDRGRSACVQLEQEGVVKPPKFHQLDITDEASIARFRDYTQRQYKGLDVLVNNAGIAYNVKSTVAYAEQTENTIKVNFTATLNVCKALFPLIRTHGRVVHVSSGAGVLSRVPSQVLRNEFSRADLEESELVKMVAQFVEDTKVGNYADKGWPTDLPYVVSKLALNVLTCIQARENKYEKSRDVLINCCCPGSCRTDMAGGEGPKSAEEGAETPVYLALLPPGLEQPHGKYVREKKEESWK